MLSEIHINHLITIEKLDLEMGHGTSVITGESGAGKSILIDAIEIALGGRVHSGLIRPNQEKAEICLCFNVSKLNKARAWLKSFELDSDTHECIIRRVIYQDGRSKTYINDMPITLAPLRELAELLINIHGQHEHQALLKSEHQRIVLDEFANHDELVLKVQHYAEEWSALNASILELKKQSQDRLNRIEYLKFQVNEFETINFTANEFELLDAEHKQLAHAEELLKYINTAAKLIMEDEENNALKMMDEALRALESVQRYQPKITSQIESLKNCLLQMNDIGEELQRYLNSIELDPERLFTVEGRISLLFNLARKYKIDPHELYDYQQKILAELKELESSDEKLIEYEQQLSSTQLAYFEVADKLTASRKKSAKTLAKQITQTLQKLSLPHGEFCIEFEKHEKETLSPHGMEKIIFLIKTNPDQPQLPLAKIASGGELSRVSLAIHIATACKDAIPTLIFDEVDVGVSGRTAEVIGKLLQKLGEDHQVLCISHVPQVASLAHHHLHVEKVHKNNQTFTHIRNLDKKKERIDEIARMLGGEEISKTTLAHAKELVG